MRMFSWFNGLKRRLSRRAVVSHRRRQYVATAILVMTLLTCCAAGDAWAGSIASSQTFAYVAGGSGGDTQLVENTTTASGTQADSSESSSMGLASSFSQVVPRQVGALSGSPLVEFRNSDSASLNDNRSSTGYQDYSQANAFSSWSDVLHFEALSPAASAIASWGIMLDLSGRLENNVTTALPGTHGGYSSVLFYATWGNSPGTLSHELYDSGVLSFDHELSAIIASQGDPFASAGIELNTYLSTYAVVGYSFSFNVLSGIGSAAADFGSTGRIAGVFGLDVNGIILPDAPAWARVTSDSGAEYQILSNAVPEPSALTIFGTGSLLILLYKRRRAKCRELVPGSDVPVD